MQDLLFACGKQRLAVPVDDVRRFWVRQGRYKVGEQLVLCPYLSLVDAPDALAQEFESQVGAAKDSFRAGTKQGDDFGIVGVLGEDDGAGIFVGVGEGLKDGDGTERVRFRRADEDDIDREGFGCIEQTLDVVHWGDDLDIWNRFECTLQKLAEHDGEVG